MFAEFVKFTDENRGNLEITKKETIFVLIMSCLLPLQSHSITKACWNDKTECIDFIGANLTCSKIEEREYILPRIDPGEVGSVESLQLIPGMTHVRIAKAKKPPIFEIPNFLTDEECDYLITKALSMGLQQSGMMGNNGVYVRKDGENTRRGKHRFFRSDIDPRLRFLQRRISSLTKLSDDLLDEGEGFQVAYYEVGGHYGCHHDSSFASREDLMVKPCCHQIFSHHSLSRCNLCRYVTVLIYLNDVEEGGETAFPLADKESIHDEDTNSGNVSQSCMDASLIVKPEKGKAIMWYNNIRDPETGWLGTLDPFSFHCGCPVLRGNKWISNFWVAAPTYSRRYKNSAYAIRWK